MAINYEPVGWDTSKFVNPTNMNKMDNGIKEACDEVDKLNASLAQRNLKTYSSLAQLELTVDNTLTEIMAALPKHSVLQVAISAVESNLANSLPGISTGMLICRKGNDATRGSAECMVLNGSKAGVYRCSYIYSKLSAWKRLSNEDDVNSIWESLNIKPNSFTGQFTSLADFWNAYTSIAISTGNAFAKFRGNNWTPTDSWFRAWVSAQNSIGNGNYDVGGCILLTNGSEWWSGTITGGKTDTSDLAVTWHQFVTLSMKPSGSYTGNGSATERTIETNGSGGSISFQSNSGMMGIISSVGTMYVTTNGAFAFSKKIHLTGSNNSQIYIKGDFDIFNVSGATYYYQVL